MSSKDTRKRRNGIDPDRVKGKTLAELQEENADLKAQVEEQADALMELAGIIAEEA